MKKERCENCKWSKIIDQDPLGIAGGSTQDIYCKKFNKEIIYNEQAVCECYEPKWWRKLLTFLTQLNNNNR